MYGNGWVTINNTRPIAEQQSLYQLKTMLETVFSILSVPRLLSKRRPHFKTHKSCETAKIWSWVPRGPKTKNNCAGEDWKKFTGLDWS
jgi:hypothetical protein